MDANHKIDNNDVTQCFYCKRKPANPDDAYKHTLYYVHDKMKLWVGYRYTNQEVLIPRCPDCHKKHDSFAGIYLLLLLVGFAIWFWIFKKDDSETSIWACAFGAFWLTLFTVALPIYFLNLIFFQKLKGIPHEEDFDDYPPVKKLLSEGWLKSRPDPSTAKKSVSDKNTND